MSIQERVLTSVPDEESVVPSTINPSFEYESPVDDGTVVTDGNDIEPEFST